MAGFYEHFVAHCLPFLCFDLSSLSLSRITVPRILGYLLRIRINIYITKKSSASWSLLKSSRGTFHHIHVKPSLTPIFLDYICLKFVTFLTFSRARETMSVRHRESADTLNRGRVWTKRLNLRYWTNGLVVNCYFMGRRTIRNKEQITSRNARGKIASPSLFSASNREFFPTLFINTRVSKSRVV